MAFDKIGGSDPDMLIGAMSAARRRLFLGFEGSCYLGYLASLCQHDELYRCPRIYPTGVWIHLAWRHIWDLKEPCIAIDRSKQRNSSETVPVSLSLSMPNAAKECSEDVLGSCVEISSSLGTTGQEGDSVISGAKQIVTVTVRPWLVCACVCLGVLE